MRYLPWIMAAILTGTATPQLAVAQAACPKEAVTGKGVVLESAIGRKTEIAWLDRGQVKVVEHNTAAPRSFPRELVTLRGLLGVQTSTPSGDAKLSYQTPLEGIFPLEPGKQHEIAYSSQVEGKPALKGRMALAVFEALEHKIGACTYQALLVARFSVFDNGDRTPVRYDVYVPQLQAVLKSTLFDESRNSVIEQETFEFETITAK